MFTHQADIESKRHHLRVEPKKWFRVIQSAQRPTIRLVCFPFAGGRADHYRSWLPFLPNDVEMLSVELPGHGTRIREPLRTDLSGIACDIAENLPSSLSANLVLFGHSMGATLAYEVACRLRELGRAAPTHLFVSARPAPSSRFVGRLPVDQMTDNELVQTIRSLQGVPEEIASSDGWFELVLPVLKADFTAVDKWTYQSCCPLSTPITSLRGKEDETTKESDMTLWANHTSTEFNEYVLDGGHFFINGNEKTVVSLILRLCKS
jgi:medium-chain acyl-[acyl-carrier-protein] hydrolase